MKSLIIICIMGLISIFDCKVDEEEVEVKRCIPYDGPFVMVGNQIWTGENYGVNYLGSKVYNNDESNRILYGGLYTYDMIIQSDFVPCGCHVPTQDEWRVLFVYLGLPLVDANNWYDTGSVVGGKLKSIRTSPDLAPMWNSPNLGAVDLYGLSFLPGGCYLDGYGFAKLGGSACYFGIDGVGGVYVPDVEIENVDALLHLSYEKKVDYLSVRFIKD